MAIVYTEAPYGLIEGYLSRGYLVPFHILLNPLPLFEKK